MPRVLLTEGEQRSTLAVARSLGQAGCEIIVASASGRSMTGASRHVRADIAVPNVGSDPIAHKEALSRVIKDHRIDALIPMTDASASVLLDLRAAHQNLVIPLPSSETWMAATDKAALVELAVEVGVPVPDGVVLTSPDDETWRRWAAERYPVILKPHRSVVFDGSSLHDGPVGIVYDAESMDERLRGLPSECFPVLVQERVVGPGRGAFFLADRGHITAAFAHERIREKPPTGGVSVLRRAAPVRDDILSHSERLLRELKWSGVAMVEFKEDARTGTPYLMEINGRFWGSLQLAIDAGVDFPRLLMIQAGVIDDTGPRPDAITPPEAQSRWLLGDLDHLIWMLKAPAWKRKQHGLGSRAGALRRFLSSHGSQTRLEVLAPDDARPFVREATDWVRALFDRKR